MTNKKRKTEAEELEEVMPVSEPEQEPAPAEAPAPAPAEPVVYLGPDIERVVNHGTVFADGLPWALEEKIKEIPAIKGLIVPVSRYAEVAMKVTLKEGRYRTLYDTVKKAR